MDQLSIGISLGSCAIFVIFKAIKNEHIELTDMVTITLSAFLVIQAIMLIINSFAEIPVSEFVLTKPIAGIVVSYISISRIVKIYKSKDSNTS
jgi:hypothetical protein